MAFGARDVGLISRPCSKFAALQVHARVRRRVILGGS